MKKIFFLTSAFLLGAGVANSQEAFKHLSVGLEAATTGVGLELALPIVSDHLVLAAGYNFGNVNVSTTNNQTLDLAEFSDNINKYVIDANIFLSNIPGESARLVPMPSTTTINGSGAVRLGTFKAVLEYYPARKNNFHINAGVYIGSSDIFTMDISCPDFWDAYSSNLDIANRMSSSHPDFKEQIDRIPELKASFNGKTYQIKDPGNINMGLKVASVRPYLGLGFGRSIPETHFAFQFDFGAIYTGKLAITSTNEVGGTTNVNISNNEFQKVMDIVGKICVYPQLSFRLIYRIF